MQKTTKKFMASILAALTLLTCIPLNGFSEIDLPDFSDIFNFSAFAAERTVLQEGSCGENATFVLYNDGEFVISGTGAMTDWATDQDIPWGFRKFSIKKITINSGITTIGDLSFRYCKNLQSVIIPESMTSIGEQAFENCQQIKSINIPANVTSIGYMAFYGCENLTNIYIPSKVETIGYEAFYGCHKLKTINIPASVTEIEYGAFLACENLTSFNVDKKNKHFASKNGVLFNKEMTKLIQYPNGNIQTSYSIPYGVTCIKDSGFKDCYNLTSVTIPTSVTIIESNAFFSFYDYWDNLTDVYYTGTEEQWNSIKIGEYNNNLINATIHFNWVVINDCDHMCHKDGFLGFIWKIINFFNKLFNSSPICECGAAHY